MQRRATLTTTAFAAAGILTALLRLIHKTFYFTDGLPDNGILSTLLTAIPIAAIIVCFITANVIASKKMTDENLSARLPLQKNIVYLLSQIIAAILVLIHGYISYPTFPELFKNHNAIALPLAAAFAIAHIVSAICVFYGKNGKLAGYLSILTPFYFCLQLGEIFFANMANPILLEYTYECLALGCFAMYSIAFAGCLMGKDQVFGITLTGLIVLVCAIASFLGPQFDPKRFLLYIAVLLIVLPNLTVLLKNLIKRVKKEKKSSKTTEAESTQE